ncbi:hypothetical protein HPP92_014580 [Vanilla planifolia]|uniref:GATA-type domain-containing protein n=1 Tax=Vanilla planifolia TaxID=51239 RepID=A0A835UT95_VANPL|nr:hypothetical protein HPP92_014580 [Vanilla planifolia]
MLHQTLLSFRPLSTPSSFPKSSPFSSALSSSSSSLSAGRRLSSPPSYPASSKVEMEVMREMLSSAHEQRLLKDDGDEVLWSEEFQVEDLLDLRGLPESEEGDLVEDEKEGTSRVVISEASFCPSKLIAAAEKESLQASSEITIPEETDAASLEWLSRFFDDCSTEFPPPLPPSYFGMSAPASSITTMATSGLSFESFIPVKAKRSKRLRGDGAVWLRSARPCPSPASSVTTAATSSPSPSSSCSSSSYPSYISYEPNPGTALLLDLCLPAKEPKPKKRGRKPKNPFAGPGERRCTHCGVQKTPQWRAGPHGAKTLCNACGVRYKSGRLLPEYRPACSPTFVSSVHSNSHRKVLEMRRKKEEQLLASSAPPVPSF